MATVMRGPVDDRPIDYLTGTPRAHALDRWIYVIMAAWFIVIVLVGFIPDSLMKMEMVRLGQRPPFPAALHVHAVLMGSFLLFLMAQTLLVATGRCALHRKIGPIGGLLAAALVVAGFVVAPTMYHQVWDGIAAAPPEAKEALRQINHFQDNILLLQMRIGILFPLLIALSLRARQTDPGFHKRMMILAPATALPAAIDRITWLPHSMPANPLSPDLYVLAAIAPLVLWDVARNGRVHRAYWVFVAMALPFTIFVHLEWDTPWWHQTARTIMGV